MAKGRYLAHCPRCGLDLRRCLVPNCGRPHNALGYCHTHYRRLRVYGDVLATIPVEPHGNRFVGIIPKSA